MTYTALEMEAYRRWFERQIAAGDIAARHEYIWWLAAVEQSRGQSSSSSQTAGYSLPPVWRRA
jgi:hypothetical protein